MTLLHHPEFASWARGHLRCRVESPVGDRFALTFDDGPSARWTPRVLAALARHGARATFFLLAGAMSRHPDLVRRIVDEGHEAALHGHRHWPLPLVTDGLLRDEIRRAAVALDRAAGVGARHFRPPFGVMLPRQSALVRQWGFEPVLGDVYPEDPHRPGVARIARRVLARLREGSIVILHDGSPYGEADRGQTVAALETILESAAARGLRPVTVAELLEAAAESRPLSPQGTTAPR